MFENSDRHPSPTVAGPTTAVGAQSVAAASVKEAAFCSYHNSEKIVVACSDTQDLLLMRRTSTSASMGTFAVPEPSSAATRTAAVAVGAPILPQFSTAADSHSETIPAAAATLSKGIDGASSPAATRAAATLPRLPPPPPLLISVSRSAAVPIAVLVARLAGAGVVPPEIQLEEPATLPQSLQSVLHALAGAVGAMLSMVCVYPLDYIRTVQSVMAGGSRSARTLAKVIVSREGWRGLYRGLRSALWGVVVSWGVYFFVYNHMKKKR